MKQKKTKKNMTKRMTKSRKLSRRTSRNRNRSAKSSMRKRVYRGGQAVEDDDFVNRPNAYSVDDAGQPNSMMASVQQNLDALPPSTMNIVIGTVAAAALGVGVYLTIR